MSRSLGYKFYIVIFISFQRNDIPLATRMPSSYKSVKSKGDLNSPRAEKGGISNTGCDDLEMVCRATKANKVVVDDGPVHTNRSIKNKRREKIADNIDRASRVLFPLVFIIYNIFYWAYY